MNSEDQVEFLKRYNTWQLSRRTVDEFVSTSIYAEKAKRYDELVESHGSLLHYDPVILDIAVGLLERLWDVSSHQNLTEEDWVETQETVAKVKEYHRNKQ